MEVTTENCKEAVLFNSDTLSKIISFLPSVDLLNLALTNKRFGLNDDDDSSVIKKSTQILVKEIATKEQLAALPHYNGESSLADYHYLQLMREPLGFDQLVGRFEYVNSEDKSCVICSDVEDDGGTAFSNNILRAGKHYVSFTFHSNTRSSFIGVMRPGQANESAKGFPFLSIFYENFSRSMVHGEDNNNDIHCCMYNAYSGDCFSSDWVDTTSCDITDWDGMESMASDGDILGLLLDLDEGTLSVYKNSRKLGVMKSGLAGEYCWIASMWNGTSVSIKRGMIPSS